MTALFDATPTYWLVEYAGGRLATKSGPPVILEAKRPDQAIKKFYELTRSPGWRDTHPSSGTWFPTVVKDVGVCPICRGPGNYGKPCQGCLHEMRGE